MKRVKYVIGAMGMAPALGLLAPTTNAAAATTQAQGKVGKTVLLEHWNIAPAVTCASEFRKTAKSGLFSGNVDYSPGCIRRTVGDLNKSQTGLEMRTRVYSGGVRVYQGFVHGSISPIFSFTHFVNNGISKHGHQACEALVSSTNHAVKYGPVCENV